MFAVIRTGGKQYKVSEGATLSIEKVSGDVGSNIDFNEILLYSDGSSTSVGQPLLESRSVKAEILEQGLGKKLISFKKIRRQGKKRKIGHRQELTKIKITGIA